MISLFKEQPKAFYLIFMLEFWERFGFYTVNGILAYFFVHQLGFSDSQAYMTFGAYSALVYGLVCLGGYIGDKVLGTKRTILLGLIVLCVGYLALSQVSGEQVFTALGIIAVGNGLFKANPSSLLAKCYQPQDPRLHGAFTLYYMAINVGSILALLVGPFLMERWGWSSAFFVSFVGLFSAVINFLYQRQSIAQIASGADAKPLCFKRLYSVLIGVVLASYACRYLLQHVHVTEVLLMLVIAGVLAIYFYYIRQETGVTRGKMWVALVLMAEGVIFFTLYQQMPTSINFFAINHVRPEILGFYLNPQSFQVFNPIWIMLLSPVLASWYRRQEQTGNTLSTAHKFALGMTLCAISFLCLYLPHFFADSQFKVSSWWLVLSYFFQGFGELLVSALGVAMVAELVPEAISGFIMGMWFLTSASAGFIGGWVASMTKPPAGIDVGYETLDLYSKVFLEIGLITLLLSFFMWLLAPKLSAIINQQLSATEPEELPTQNERVMA